MAGKDFILQSHGATVDIALEERRDAPGGMWVQAAPGSLPNPQSGDWAIDALSVCDITHPEGEGAATALMRENAERIAACVNFCRGFSREALATTTLRDLLRERAD